MHTRYYINANARMKIKSDSIDAIQFMERAAGDNWRRVSRFKYFLHWLGFWGF